MIFIEIVDVLLAGLAQINDYSAYRDSASGPYMLRKELEFILDEGGSAYTIAPERDGLVRRVDETLRNSFDKAMEAGEKSGGEAGSHLRKAFVAAYGINPDPSVAYSQAVKAVEAVANPLFLPNASEPTLGKVRSHLDQGRRKYEMVIADKEGAPGNIDAVVELIGLLWHGQRDRHAGGPTTTPVSQEAAETAVHAAALLVYWMATGRIRKS